MAAETAVEPVGRVAGGPTQPKVQRLPTRRPMRKPRLPCAKEGQHRRSLRAQWHSMHTEGTQSEGATRDQRSPRAAK